MNKHVSLLRREIEYLRQFTSLPFSLDDKENDFSRLVEIKFQLMKEIKASSILNNKMIVTNFGLSQYPDRPPFLKIHSKYAGEDLEVQELEENNFFYESPAEKMFFLKSGQASLIVTWLYLFERFGNVKIINPSKIYHESQAFFQYMKEKVQSVEKSILYVDSLSWGLQSSDEFTSALKSVEFVVIDSTCWEMNSKEMNFLLDQVKRSKVPCFVVRSHIKLDTLGVEYGLLGSLFVYGAGQELTEMTQRLQKIIALTRYAAAYDELYPFCGGKDFANLVTERTLLIKENTNWCAEKLSQELKDEVRVEKFPHDLYLYLHVKKKQARANLLKVTSMEDLSLVYSDSFGFDKMTVSFVSNEERNIWRLCGSMLEQEQLEHALDLVIRAIKHAK